MFDYIRVRDPKNHRKFSVIAGSDVDGLDVLDPAKFPAVDIHGEPLPPEFPPSEQKAIQADQKES